ncbi:MAG: thioredoxin-disulfide reductase [Candidatus Omnitrophota bacterium]
MMYDLIIIGGGPAGLTAALYAGRYRLKTLLLEKMGLGGQILLSSTIENYPGFPGGISTQELMEKFKQQIDELNIEIQMEEVLGISVASGSVKPLYHVKAKEKSFETKAVIIATGAMPKRLGIPGENKLTGRGVSYCGTCDGPLFKNKDIMVIGGGDRAIEEAIFLTGYARSVTVVHRRDQLRASKITEEKAQGLPNLKFLLDSVVEEIGGENKVEALRVKNVKTNALSVIPCQGVFIFAGIVPNTAFINNLLNLDGEGFIISGSDSSTTRPGLFACGDCVKKSLYQVVTACGEGATASAGAQRYLL